MYMYLIKLFTIVVKSFLVNFNYLFIYNRRGDPETLLTMGGYGADIAKGELLGWKRINIFIVK